MKTSSPETAATRKRNSIATGAFLAVVAAGAGVVATNDRDVDPGYISPEQKTTTWVLTDKEDVNVPLPTLSESNTDQLEHSEFSHTLHIKKIGKKAIVTVLGGGEDSLPLLILGGDTLTTDSESEFKRLREQGFKTFQATVPLQGGGYYLNMQIPGAGGEDIVFESDANNESVEVTVTDYPG